MTVTRYPYGDGYWFDLAATGLVANYTFQALLSSFTPDITTQRYIDDVSASFPTDPTWTRVTVTGAVVTRDTTSAYTTITADSPNFGAPAGAENVGYVALFADTGVDTTAEIMAVYEAYHAADGVTNWTPAVHPLGLARFENL